MAFLFSSWPTGGLSLSSGYTVTSMCSMNTDEGQRGREEQSECTHQGRDYASRGVNEVREEY